MTEGEIDLFRWFEVFTLGGANGSPIPENDARGRMAVARGYVAPVPNTSNYDLTPRGWDWFAARCSRVTAACSAGRHVLRAKGRTDPKRFCLWCGVADEAVSEPGL